MAIKTCTSIQIRQLGNGYFVSPGANDHERSVAGDDDRLVFQSFAELTKWLSEHFDFRCTSITEDD